jgi:hypothetical protein
MYVTLESQNKMACIGLRPHGEGIVAESGPLADLRRRRRVQTLHDLILDFDAKGRLIGIEVMNAKQVLPGALLDEAKRI